MLTQDSVRKQLDAIAHDVSQAPGIYHELFARVFSARIHQWIRNASDTDADLIARVAENDPDYLGDIESEIEMPDPIIYAKSQMIFNPDWDVTY